VRPIDLSLRGQAEAVASGEADPSELLGEALARIEERNPALNAIVETFPDRSREMLAAAPDGPLRGVPVVIKDEWPLPWRAQRFGSAAMLKPTAPGESGPYRALRDAGAVIVGVGNMEELGAGSTGAISVYGPAHNPWDTDRCPGGSSSGPAASVAARLVGGAVGADGLGSLRYPAAYCGLTGLKPTFARSAMDGHHAAATTTTIVSGPLCVDAADCRLLAGALYRERLTAGDASGLRIGIVHDVPSEDVDPEVREACEAAIETLRAETGGTIREVALPDLAEATIAAILIANSDGLAGVMPDQPRRPQVPDADPRGRRIPGSPGSDPRPAPPRCPARGRRCARLADRSGPGAAARGADRRASLRDRDRRPRQRPRRRPRQPDRHAGGQRPGRAHLLRAADRPPARDHVGKR
jgi:Asp-tRNA(Asn)/Glu-tRNA(Gln) amidotransferase A subunit family amidase